ncbi:MAG: hypothetical protein ACRDFS_03085, partial [Chloroflexota bacterium]
MFGFVLAHDRWPGQSSGIAGWALSGAGGGRAPLQSLHYTRNAGDSWATELSLRGFSGFQFVTFGEGFAL